MFPHHPFRATVPATQAELQRASDFTRRQPPGPRDTGAGSTWLSELNPSLLQDLLRFDAPQRGGEGLELLEVLAASVRHARPLLLHLEHDNAVLPLSVFPLQRQAFAPLDPQRLLTLPVQRLRVLRVAPAASAPPDGEAGCCWPLGPLLWELALRGAREALLPEIAGPAAYRIAPGADLAALELQGSMARAVRQLQREPASLRHIAAWPGFDRDRAMRMLNGLYLQAALIVSRSHPAAIQEP